MAISGTTFTDKHVMVNRIVGGDAGHSEGGKAVVAADFAIHAGWGTAAAIAVDSGSTDRRGSATVTAGSPPGANPTVTLTFCDGPWEIVPFVVVCRTGGTA